MIKKVLFLCLGNICRSPTAESIFRKKAHERGLQIEFDSAGTSSLHAGEKSDPRSIRHAKLRGYELTHLSRPLTISDFKNFDLILAMDESNIKNALKIAPKEFIKKLKLVTEYCKSSDLNEVTNPNYSSISQYTHVPDPYYGDSADFNLVIDILEKCADEFFNKLK